MELPTALQTSRKGFLRRQCRREAARGRIIVMPALMINYQSTFVRLKT